MTGGAAGDCVRRPAAPSAACSRNALELLLDGKHPSPVRITVMAA